MNKYQNKDNNQSGRKPVASIQIEKMRKIAVFIGFLLMVITNILELLFSENRTFKVFLLGIITSTVFFFAALYNVSHPMKGRFKYPFIIAVAPFSAIVGFIFGSLLYTYPLGIIFVILWLYLSLEFSYQYSLSLNIFIIIIYIVSDLVFIHYSFEYKVFNMVFIIFTSSLGFISSYIIQQVQSDLNYQYELTIRTAEKLEKELQTKTEMYSSLAHEVKTPLTIIRHYFSKYRKNNIDSKELNIIQDNLDKLERRMTTMLKFEREMLSGNKPTSQISTGSCDIGILIKNNIPLLNTYFERKNVNIEFDIRSGFNVALTQIDCEHIFLNLLENSLRYTDCGGTVTLKLQNTKNAEVMLSISDTGIGMDAVELERIFEPYVQIEQIRSSKQGLGMGLAIVKKIVERTGGSISVTSKKGEGTEFIVLLPIGGKSNNDSTSQLILPPNFQSLNNTAKTQIKKHSGSFEYSVFLVEDNEDLREFLSDFLSDEYTVSAFPDGQDALAAITRENIPDLIISDVYMEKMDGIGLIENINNLYPDIRIPFIYISADDTEQMRLRGLGKGALDYITKPFSPEEMKLKISTWIDLLSDMDEADKMALESLELDYQLTPREIQIAYMLRQGLPRTDISQKLFISANTVKTHISSIYSKCNVGNKSEFLSLLKKNQS
ncbi:MAG: ATP-binding protein [Spirochaetales bacterium]|nr:ATP-binding protein [Spirochaetales bacterium]